ncbi:DegT/DnrJ/EryC1/StrS family aminotransferase [Azospirillum sp. INR13]|uniref:DegT/DnrJ/EryC1/StrS family aminotransferase n=1 Tax=Azospirillum sp. INR13 TaxID=2596919 RepID=UPI001892794F|nr:DegT/DnrJ/EryC1/StrS family aminotransferase [Azospirillum sp. INR13]MBF5093483.1 DegT/DnrJ/EryC1/StrS family aminotransferase [Azospirillum sp. INR13]
MREIPYVNFAAQFAEEREELLSRIEAVFSRGDFVGGPAVDRLEEELAAYHGVPADRVVALNSGTDALILGMKALGIGPGDEVITPPNSFVASAATIAAIGATPVFADVLDDQTIDPDAVAAAITPRTKAIMPVHLTGRIAEMAPLQSLAERHRLAIVEDAAQSIGSWYHGRISGTFGDIGCFSLHPLKNLNAAGDAGFLIARDAEVARRVRLWRSHGLVDRNTVTEFGTVSRLDGLQAEILRFRLTRLPSVLERRRHNAARYRELLAGLPVFIPAERPDTVDTYHTFVIQLDRRDELRDFLASRGVMTAIHYPVPLHLQPAAAGLGKGPGSFPRTERQAARIVTLPVNQFLSDEDLVYVVEQMAEFYR